MGQAEGMEDRPAPPLQGIHHVRVPASDVGASRNWYREVLGFEAVLDFEEEGGLIGTVLSHHSGLATIGLHLDPERAAALLGFCLLALQAEGQSALYDWESISTPSASDTSACATDISACSSKCPTLTACSCNSTRASIRAATRRNRVPSENRLRAQGATTAGSRDSRLGRATSAIDRDSHGND